MIVLPSIRLNAIRLLTHLRGVGVPRWRVWTAMNWLPIFGGGAMALETAAVAAAEPRDGAGEDAGAK